MVVDGDGCECGLMMHDSDASLTVNIVKLIIMVEVVLKVTVVRVW